MDIQHTMIDRYILKIEKIIRIGNYTEHSFRPMFKELIDSISNDIEAINEPTREKYGSPDFLILKERYPLGYIETKKIGANLEDVEESEQLLRYREGISNLILTNYIDFRWYVNGSLRLKGTLADIDLKKNTLIKKISSKDVTQVLSNFLMVKNEISNSEELAKQMAHYALYIKSELQLFLKSSDRNVRFLKQQLDGFRQILLNDLTEDELSDMYAQTICYGLFAARLASNDEDMLTRFNASYAIPQTNPFLRRLFNEIIGPDLNEKIGWIVDDLVKLLNATKINKILYSMESHPEHDPIIHFYETFLSYYDQSIRSFRGVYFTPKSIVSFIVRSVNIILKEKFNLDGGLANSSLINLSDNKQLHKVQILDPASGTGTFLNEIIQEVYKTFENNKGLWTGYVKNHLLPRLYGFEILMAPYTVSHMKLSVTLKELGYDISSNERLRVYLTNTLEEVHEMVEQPFFSYWLSEEANAAREIKRDVPVVFCNKKAQKNAIKNAECCHPIKIYLMGF
ncbi:hypothetical protein GCM10008967_29890 [Bacillus carboniphilus]|uniref:DNA methylase adenine-specific domain-containing protein n=1 Tax=Bacillus carboniphilus TaxID=86663 RepID=A0ABN0WH93_9BACI